MCSCLFLLSAPPSPFLHPARAAVTAYVPSLFMLFGFISTVLVLHRRRRRRRPKGMRSGRSLQPTSLSPSDFCRSIFSLSDSSTFTQTSFPPCLRLPQSSYTLPPLPRNPVFFSRSFSLVRNGSTLGHSALFVLLPPSSFCSSPFLASSPKFLSCCLCCILIVRHSYPICSCTPMVTTTRQRSQFFLPKLRTILHTPALSSILIIAASYPVGF